MRRNKKKDLFEFIREIYNLKTSVITNFNHYEKNIIIDDFCEKYSNIATIKRYSDDLCNTDEVFQLKYITELIAMPKTPEQLKDYIDILDGKVHLKSDIEISANIEKTFSKYQEKVKETETKNKFISEYNELYKYFRDVFRRKEEYEEKIEVVYCKGLLLYSGDDIKGASQIKRHVFEVPITLTVNDDSNIITLKLNREQNSKLITDFLKCITNFEVKNAKKIAELNDKTREEFSSGEAINFDELFKNYLNNITLKYQYLNKDNEIKMEENKFYIKNEECIIVRKKQPTVWIEDLNRILQTIEEKGKFESENKLVDLILEEKSEEQYQKLISCEPDDARILFPLPTNEEQYRVVEQLRDSNLVLVQGPPGTGKSHTIANLISTYIANGKKILVTSEKSKALEVVKDKLPEPIKDLSMTVLNENGNNKELEVSISNVLEKFKDKEHLNTYQEKINQYEKKLEKLDDKILNNKNEILDFFNHSTKSYEEQIKHYTNADNFTSYMPIDIARYLNQYQEYDGIIEDYNNFYDINFDVNFLEKYGEIFNKVKDNQYINNHLLPKKEIFEAFFDKEKIKKIFDNKEKIEEIVNKVTLDENKKVIEDDIIIEEKYSQEVLNKILEYEKTLKYIYSKLNENNQEVMDQILNEYIPWVKNADLIFDKEFIEENKEYTPRLNNAQKLITLCEDKKEFLEKVETLLLENTLEYNQEQAEELKNIAQKLIELLKEKNKIGMFDKFKLKAELEKISEAKINQLALSFENLSVQNLQLLLDKIIYDDIVKEILGKLNKTLKLKTTFENKENEISREINEIIKVSTDFIEYHQYEKNYKTGIESIFDDSSNEVLILSQNKEYDKMLDIFSYLDDYREIEKIKYKNSQNQIKRNQSEKELQLKQEAKRKEIENNFDTLKIDIENFIKKCKCPELFKELFLAIESIDIEKFLLEQEKINKIYELEDEFNEIKNTYKNEWTKYPKLIQSYEKMEEENRNNIIKNFDSIVNYYKIKTLFLDEIISNKKYDDLFKEKNKYQLERQRVIVKLLETQAWYYQIQNMDRIMAKSLSTWLSLKHKLGKGTGKKANLLRKSMQEEMQKAKDAIPIWIMPIDKVVEQYPFCGKPQFDLIIMDESSQSSIVSISALLRGKKIVIVGDDKQISPQSVGIEIKDLQKLQKKYLAGTSLEAFLDNETSIYDLVQSICGSKKVVLKEHFRCLPEIIEFSNQNFYHNNINCLKVRTNENTIAQAIKTEYVEEATVMKKGASLININEIDRIIEILKQIENDKRYQNKTIGIIALQNSVLHLNTLNDELQLKFSSQFRNRTKLKIGTTYDFQGDERDVIILSMIISTNYENDSEIEDKTIRPLTKLSFEKSFNVAASRAKEQVILVHSVKLNELSSNDLRYKLLSYYENNILTTEHKSENIFYTDFEKDIYNELIKKEINLDVHYRIGKYELDFVIKNKSGKKVAIECDGDVYKTEKEYEEEIEKQNVLERCGWNYIRINAFDYYYNKNNTMQKVMEKVNENIADNEETNDNDNDLIIEENTQLNVSIPIDENEYSNINIRYESDFNSFVAFDLETTGFSSTNDSITEIGAIRVVDGQLMETKQFTFQELVKPIDKKIPYHIEKLTGITNEMVKNSRNINDVFNDFMNFVRDDILIGFNSNTFDSKFLIEAGKNSHRMIKNEFFDVMLYANKFKEKLLVPEIRRFSLGKICELLNITNSDAHRALSDAITTAKVFLNLKKIENNHKIINSQHIETMKKEKVLVTDKLDQKNINVENELKKLPQENTKKNELLIEAFINYYGTRKKASNNTLESYKRDLTSLENYFNTKCLELLKKEEIEEYIEDLKKVKKDSTIARTLASIKSFFIYLSNNGYKIDSNITRIRSVKVEKKILTFEDKQNEKIYKEKMLNQRFENNLKGIRDKAIIYLSNTTAIKATELISLNVIDFDYKKSQLHVRKKYITLEPEVSLAINEYIQNSRKYLITQNCNILFLNMQGSALTRQGYWKIQKSYES